MRKTQRCSATKLMQIQYPTGKSHLKIRTCDRPRNHDGDHRDDAGNWRSTPVQSTEYDPAIKKEQ